jgi:serine/threonine protein kinase
LGRGVEGGVTGVLHIPTCEVYALKSTNSHSEIKKYRILKKLTGGERIPQLMELNGLFEDRNKNKVALVLDYMNLGSLHGHFTARGNECSNEQMRYIARESLLGLRTLHGFDTPIVHCDIKPQNILLASGGSVRIGDYGCMQLLRGHQSKAQEQKGTIKYFSPERHEGSFGMPADIWALGVTLVECLRGSLIETEELKNVRVAAKTSPLDFIDIEEFDEETIDFLRHCLDTDPTKRWDAKRLLSHPIFTPDFLSVKSLFPAPERNEALLTDILNIVKEFIQSRIEQSGRLTSIGNSKDNVWSHAKEISHAERLDNMVNVTGFTVADVQKVVDEMYEKRMSSMTHSPSTSFRN